MNRPICGFTLIELMVVILIIAILAGVAIPLMQIRVENSKWTEANAAAGMIRSAVKTAYFQSGAAPTGNLGEAGNLADLGIAPSDLTGTYFIPADYEIVSVNADGIAVVTVTGSLPNAPSGSRTLTLDGTWE